MKISAYVLIALAAILAIPTVHADTPVPASELSPAQQDAEIQSVKLVVAKVSEVKSMVDLGQYMTNKSAGYSALIIGGIAFSFGSALDSAANSLNSLGTSTKPPKLTESKYEKSFEAVLTKYGISKSEQSPDAALQLHGRALFSDVFGILASMPGTKQERQNTSTIPSDIDYKVVSSTQVDLSSSTPKGFEMSAFLEDGQWRLDVFDPDKMGMTSGGTPDSGPSNDSSAQSDAAPTFTSVPNPPMINAINEDSPDKVAAIAAADPSSVNKPDLMGDTPLYSASFFGHADVVSALLDAGAEVNAVDKNGDTSLIQAVAFNKIDIVKLLLSHGARTGYKDVFGRTALAIAKKAHEAEIAHMLMAAGATR